MKYFEEIDAWLEELLTKDKTEVKQAIKDKLLESYRNGQKAGLRTPPKFTPRTRGRK